MTGHKARGSMVQILMGVYDGAAVLPDQLQSLADQTHAHWQLVCSDDGSSDGTRDVIAEFSSRVPQEVVLADGPRAGFSANFMHLLGNIGDVPPHVALADQDDVWLPEKLDRALHALAGCDPDRPALYCARRWLWEPDTDRRRATPPAKRPPSFRNALIENIAPGNTIVLNRAAACLARDAARRTGAVFAHDWWLYLLITGAGGQVVCDDGPPCLLYRQHPGNVIGGGRGLGAQVVRKLNVLQGAFRDRVQGNLAAMRAVQDVLTPENRQVLRAFGAALDAGLPARLAGLARVAPYRQSRLGSFGFWGAALLGRV